MYNNQNENEKWFLKQTILQSCQLYYQLLYLQKVFTKSTDTVLVGCHGDRVGMPEQEVSWNCS